MTTLSRIKSLLEGDATRPQSKVESGMDAEIEFDNKDKWMSYVKKHWPKAKLTTEDGRGKTYGEPGDITAHTGPDMQADVVGTWTHDDNHGWVAPQSQSKADYIILPVGIKLSAKVIKLNSTIPDHNGKSPFPDYPDKSVENTIKQALGAVLVSVVGKDMVGSIVDNYWDKGYFTLTKKK